LALQNQQSKFSLLEVIYLISFISSFSEMRNLHRRARENALRIFQENENLRIDLENKRRELNLRAKDLEKMSAENANDRKTLDDEKQKVS